jgi:hypothetical protein
VNYCSFSKYSSKSHSKSLSRATVLAQFLRRKIQITSPYSNDNHPNMIPRLQISLFHTKGAGTLCRETTERCKTFSVMETAVEVCQENHECGHQGNVQ